MDEDMQRNWQALSEEVLSGMKEWRLAHPKATFREIEQAVEQRVNRLKARMLQDASLASAAKDWRDAPERGTAHVPSMPNGSASTRSASTPRASHRRA